MTTAIKRRRGTTAQHATFTGLEGELTVDTTKDTVVVHDGATAGGFPLARESGSAISATTLAASGVATFSAGTVSAPALTTTGDTNTGIFFPAADTIAFTEGGVESMRITDAGNVAVGQSSSASQFLVKGSSTGKTVSQFIANDTQTTTMAVWERSDGAVSSRLIYDGTGLVKFGTSTAHPLVFDTANTERMRITSGGTVGIGTSSPNSTSKLHISGGGSGAFGALRFSDEGLVNNWDIGRDNNVAGHFTFALNGTQRMTIDTSGNVGIGTTSPNIYSTGDATNILGIQASGTNKNGLIAVAGTGTGYGGIEFGNATIRRSGIYTLDGSALAFYTNGTNSGTGLSERMRIDSSGNLLVGTTSNYGGRRLDLRGGTTGNFLVSITNQTSSGTPYGLQLLYASLTPNNTDSFFYTAGDATATRFQVYSNGGIANYSGNNVNLSDAREKTNVELAGNYLNKICAIPVKTFNYIDQNREEDDGLTLGVIAQDVEAVAPELVMESNWGTQDEPKMRLSIYQTDLQYALMKSIQELKATVDAQAARIAALESK
jgi:hypothetical protein